MFPYNTDKFVMPYLGIEEDGDGEENSVVFSTAICCDIIYQVGAIKPLLYRLP